jgi:hypothetical protein
MLSENKETAFDHPLLEQLVEMYPETQYFRTWGVYGWCGGKSMSSIDFSFRYRLHLISAILFSIQQLTFLKLPRGCSIGLVRTYTQVLRQMCRASI